MVRSVVRTYEPAEPADAEFVDLLVRRDGTRTFVRLQDGRRLSVCNVALAYDEGEPYAHVTTNISPRVDGASVDSFSTCEITALEDETGALLRSVE
jgi:hypothetical protein